MLRGVLRDSAVYGATDFVFRGLAFAMFPLYAYLLPVSQFGVLELLMTAVGLLGVVANQGMSNAVGRFYWEPQATEAGKSATVATGFALLLAFGALVTVLAGGALWFARGAAEARYLVTPLLAALAIASIVPAQAVQYAQDVLRLRFEPRQYVILQSVRNVLALSATIALLLWLDWGVAAVLAGALIGAASGLPVAVWYLRGDLARKPEAAVGRRLFAFGHGFMYMGLAYWVFGSMDRWMLAELSDLQNVGWYSAAFKIAAIVTFLTSAFAQAWNPHAMKVYGEHPAPGEVFGQSLMAWTAVLAGATLVLGLFAKEVLMLLTPAAYWPASTAAALCVASAAALGTTQVTALGISIAKRTGLFVVLSWGAAGVNFALNLALVPAFGATGAAAASFLTAAALSVAYLAWTQRLYPIRVDYPRLAACAATIGAVPVLAWGLDRIDEHPARFAAKLIVVALFVAAGWYGGLVDRQAIAKVLARP